MSITLSPGLRMVAIGRYMHWCPGCHKAHFFNVSIQDAEEGQPAKKFAFNGDFQQPTFTPCQHLVDERGICHYYLTNGMLQFMGDCWHPYRSQTVPLPPFPMQPLQVQPEPRP